MLEISEDTVGYKLQPEEIRKASTYGLFHSEDCAVYCWVFTVVLASGAIRRDRLAVLEGTT